MHRKYSTLDQRKENIFELVWVCMTCIMLAIMAFLLSVNLVAMDESPSSLSGGLGGVYAQALLQKAIQDGTLIDVAKAIQAGAQLSQQDDHKRTIIGAGVYYGRKDIIDYLRWRYSEYLPKASKCLLDAVKSFPSTDEIKSAKGLQRRLAILDLVAGDAQEELAGKLGGRALRAALRKRNPDFRILEILLRHGANPNDSSCPKKAPLYKALEQDEKLARVLIEHKAQVQTMMHVLTAKQLRNLQNILKERAVQADHEQLSAFIGLDTVLFPYWSMGHRAQLLARLNFEQLAALALISPEYCTLVQKHTHTLIGLRELFINPGFISEHSMEYYGREISWLDVVELFRNLFPSAKTLRITRNLLSYLDFEKLKDSPTLNLACIPLDERKIVEDISTLSQLRELDLSYTGIKSPEDAQCIGKIKGLVRLAVAGNRLTNTMITQFAGLENLQELDVSNCGLNNDSIEAIGVFLPNLTTLHVENNGLGFEGTLALLDVIKTSMPNLKRLMLANNALFNPRAGVAISPRSTELSRKLRILEALIDIKSLEELCIDEDNLTSDDIKSFRQSLLGVTITRKAKVNTSSIDSQPIRVCQK